MHYKRSNCIKEKNQWPWTRGLKKLKKKNQFSCEVLRSNTGTGGSAPVFIWGSIELFLKRQKRKEKNQFKFSSTMKVPETSLCSF